MSRTRPKDNTAVVSLFPFLAVLLCTMGALLVVLVLVASLERKEARARAVAEKGPLVSEEPPSEDTRHKLDEIDEYLARLAELRAEAQQRLRDEQSRLSHIEDHLRRLQEQLAKLLLAAEELDALSEEHVDDREQAEREVERLEQLITDKRKEIDRLRDEAGAGRRSYAIVPYIGPNGTYRRPITFELRSNAIILQPEGIRIVPEDLRPPVGPGNALAAAVRAAREYHLRQKAATGASEDNEPYAYFLVRPTGTRALMEARRAVESAGLEFGFELVEGDWDLKYPPADPRLASLVEQAVEQARMRQRLLAEAAPRMHRNPILAARGRFDAGDEEAGELWGGFGGGRGGSSGSGTFDFGESAELGGEGGLGGLGEAGTGGAGDAKPQAGDGLRGSPADIGDATGDESGAFANAPAVAGAGVGGAAAAGGAGQADTSPDAVGGASGGESSTFNPSMGEQMVGTNSDPAHERPIHRQEAAIDQHDPDRPQPRGEEWAFRKPPGAVPIRRTIHVVVRGDHVAILESRPEGDALPRGKAVHFGGSTRASMDEFVAALRKHIDDWGLAGSGFYWRPVLEMNVGPDGQRRADDIAHLLKNSGLELRSAGTATRESGGAARATR